MTRPIKQSITFGKFSNIDLRVVEVKKAPMAEGTDKPCRVLTVDAGKLGTFTSVGQFALLDEQDLVGRKLIACCNLSPRPMGPYVSEVLILGAPHPDSPSDQEQALPLFVDNRSENGSQIY
jgi:tRNA-binding protein